MSGDFASVRTKNSRASDNILERILTQVTELATEVRSLTRRMDTRASEISKLAERVSALEVRLAVNDKQTDKNANWFEYLFKGILTLFMGFVAVRIGLK